MAYVIPSGASRIKSCTYLQFVRLHLRSERHPVALPTMSKLYHSSTTSYQFYAEKGSMGSHPRFMVLFWRSTLVNNPGIGAVALLPLVCLPSLHFEVAKPHGVVIFLIPGIFFWPRVVSSSVVCEVSSSHMRHRTWKSCIVLFRTLTRFQEYQHWLMFLHHEYFSASIYFCSYTLALFQDNKMHAPAGGST